MITDNIKIGHKYLLIMAGLIWLFAGINILRIGLQVWFTNELSPLFTIAFAVVIFILFLLMFRKICSKNVKRILKIQSVRNPFAFFDLKGWIIMIFMIGLGISVRYFQLMPLYIIAPFYTGLAIALAIMGIYFLSKVRYIR